MNDEFIQIENFQSRTEIAWLRWCEQVEKLSGRSLDEDQDKAGFSLGHAYDQFIAGTKPSEYFKKFMS